MKAVDQLSSKGYIFTVFCTLRVLMVCLYKVVYASTSFLVLNVRTSNILKADTSHNSESWYWHSGAVYRHFITLSIPFHFIFTLSTNLWPKHQISKEYGESFYCVVLKGYFRTLMFQGLQFTFTTRSTGMKTTGEGRKFTGRYVS